MAIEHYYDLIVVGGGPAGSSAAYEASKNGIKVALVEREEVIAQTVRTSGVTWIQNMKEFGIPDDCYNPIRNYSFCSPNNTVTISDTVPHAAVLDVRKTYRWLAEQAKKEGVDIFLKTNISNVIKNNVGDIVGVSGTSKDGEIVFHAKVIIDASGFSSTISKSMGFVTQRERFGAGAEYEVKAEN
ncbi:MAG: NAD(P)/FAD-dependent oxidoreductase, partial [Nitrosopumilus sp.]|nr:NAD(P)/FAD-dependent oxidoreductase [Nitrosopumilus sp.]